MSQRDEINRQLGRGMPLPERDIASERYSIKHTSHVEPPPKKFNIRVVMGIVMIEDEEGWRMATAEEIERLTGGVICWPNNEEGEP
jgi:hypothetical protein